MIEQLYLDLQKRQTTKRFKENFFRLARHQLKSFSERTG
jgi:hypothetical protein